MPLFGLIGFPLTHSFSKKYFSEKFEKEGIKDCRYELFELKDINDFPSVIKNNPDLKGLNVTIPHKETVMKFLDEWDEPVKEIGAVNVIKVKDGKLKGYNSDYHGFIRSLFHLVFGDYEDQEAKWVEIAPKALVLGTGGAAKAVKAALKDHYFPFLTVSRTGGLADLTYKDIPEVISEYKLIINTTPVGMYPNVESSPDLPYDKITPEHYLFDLVYNPEETLFMKKGKEKGARTKNGLEMLKLQAEKAWEIWNKNS